VRDRPHVLSRTPLAVPAALALGGLLVLGGCQTPATEETAPPPVREARGPAPIEVSPDSWVLGTDSWGPQSRGAYLGNGYLGQRFSASGLGAEGEPAYLAGHYVNEGLAALPSLVPLRIAGGSEVFGADPARFKRYRQELRLREGILATTATWEAGGAAADLRIETALLRQQPDLALTRVHVKNHGRSALQLTVPEAASPAAGPSSRTTLWRLSEPGEPAASQEVPAGAEAEFAVVTHVSGGPVKLRNPLREVPTVDAAQVERWLEGHRQAWARLWERDIEIEGDPEAQQVVRGCLFQLLASIREENDTGVPPMGLSGNAFAGHVFWDMDSWMVPALLPQHPELARAMLEYRYRTLPGAKENARAENLPGAAYAWESGSTGRETLQGAEFIHGRHVTGDVALALKQYYTATGDREWLKSRAWPILQATAENWVARAKPDGSGGLTFQQVTTPDELAGRVDHSAWTQHVARVNLEFATEAARLTGAKADPRWLQTARKLNYLRDPETKLILPYRGFTEKTRAKQADLLLIAHPGEERLSDEELARTYDYYAPRVITNGPAMTDAIHAVIAARLGRGEEAMKRFRDTYRPFVRPPYHVFSEKRSRDNLAFQTGTAGVIEAVLYGFAGLRLEPDPSQPDRPLLQPHLPAEWKSLRLRHLQWRGKSWDVELKPGAAPSWRPHSGGGA
jgi:trehalose/maltose hydrolase-like predicted phosphorylase